MGDFGIFVFGREDRMDEHCEEDQDKRHLERGFHKAAFYLCATGFDAGTLNFREIFSSFLLLRPL